MRDTVVIPVHDDAKVLPFSLQCLKSFKGEVIFVLDKPTPESEALVRKFTRHHQNCRIVTKKPLPFKNANPASSSYIYGSLQATGDRIFWIGADIVFSPAIFENPLPLPCKFPYIQAHTHLARAYFKTLFKVPPQHCLEVFPRGFPFHKYNWYNEDVDHAAPQTLGFQFNHLKNPPVLHIRSFAHHPLRDFVKGIRRRKLNFNLARVLVSSILFLKPRSILGYVWEWRHGASGD